MPEAAIPALIEFSTGTVAAGIGAEVVGGYAAAAGIGAAATGFTLANPSQVSSIIGGAISAASALKPPGPQAPGLSPAPPAAPTLQSPTIDSAISMQQRTSAAAGGIMANIGTGPSGV